MGVNGIYGLSGSGLDIESMVKVGMMSKQNEYDKMAQKYTQNEWKKAALLEINSQITTFNMSALSDYKYSANMNARTAESSDESAVKATANADAALMSHRVDVLALSTNAHLISTGSISSIITTNDYEGSDASKTYLKDILLDKHFSVEGSNIKRSYSATEATSSITTTTTTTYTLGGGSSAPTTVTTENKDGAITSSTTLGNRTVSIEATTTGQTDSSTTQYKINIGGDSSIQDLNLNLTRNADNTFTLTGYAGTFVINSEGDERHLTFSDYDLTLDLDKSGNTDSVITLGSGTDAKKLTFQNDGSITSVTVNNTTVSEANSNKTIVETQTIKGSDGTPTLTLTTTTKAENGTETSKSTTADVKIGNDGEEYKGVTLTNTKPKTNDATAETPSDTTTSVATTETTNVTTTGSAVTVNLDLNADGSVKGYSLTTPQSYNAINFKIGDGTNETDNISFTYKDILGGKTINDLVSKINTAASNSNVNVKSAFDSVSGRFSLYNSKAGDKDKIMITAVKDNYAGTAAKNFFNGLGLAKTADGVLKNPNVNLIGEVGKATEAGTGTYGKVKIDGVLYDKVEDNKLSNINGVTYNLLKTTGTTTTEDVTTDPATVSISQNTSGIVEKVKSFVESYNKILSSLYEKYDEKSDSNYKPLTQSQKDAMTEEQIKKWEDKAKEGLLYHDSTLSKIIGQMREAISAEVKGISGTYNSAYSIGISTTGIKGQLVLDEEKLNAALANDSDSVYHVFANLDTKASVGKNGFTEENGIAQRLSDVFNSATKLIKSRAGSSSDVAEDSDLNNLLRELQTKMSNFKKLMSAFEERLYKKYDAMEAALSKLGMQLNFITGANS